MKKAKQSSKKAVWDALKKDYTTVHHYVTINTLDPATFAEVLKKHSELIRGIKC